MGVVCCGFGEHSGVRIGSRIHLAIPAGRMRAGMRPVGYYATAWSGGRGSMGTGSHARWGTSSRVAMPAWCM